MEAEERARKQEEERLQKVMQKVLTVVKALSLSFTLVLCVHDITKSPLVAKMNILGSCYVIFHFFFISYKKKKS